MTIASFGKPLAVVGAEFFFVAKLEIDGVHGQGGIVDHLADNRPPVVLAARLADAAHPDCAVGSRPAMLRVKRGGDAGHAVRPEAVLVEAP